MGNETLRPLGFGPCFGRKLQTNDVFSRRLLYCGHAGSDVMGCRRPTGGVFTYVSSDTSHAEGSVATPRGRSSSSHGGERLRLRM